MILNIELTGIQWLQASLPVRNGGIGLRSAETLATSAFLASAGVDDRTPAWMQLGSWWKLLVAINLHLLPLRCSLQHILKAWDAQILKSAMDTITAVASTAVDLAKRNLLTVVGR